MITYIVRRLLLMIPTLVGITFLVFMIIASAPGGIGVALRVSGGTMTSQTSAAKLEAYLQDRYGLDDPVPVQYLRWLSRVSPIKLGARDLIAPDGTRVRAPREAKPPPLAAWYDDGAALEENPPADPLAGETARERYIAADRAHADARQAYIGAVTDLKQAIGRYARAAKVRDGLTREGDPRLGRLARHQPVRALPEFTEVERLGRAALSKRAALDTARARLVGAIREKPYPQAGLPIIPGVVSIDTPDLGVAYSRQRPVKDLIATALPVTLLLNAIAFPIIYLVAVPGGMLAAMHRGTWIDASLGFVKIALWSTPTVLAGVIAQGFFASPDYLHAFPVAGLHDARHATMPFFPTRVGGDFVPGYLLDTLWHLCLPVTCLVYTGFAVLSKQTRAALLDNYNADYVRTAKAKGVSDRDILLRHVFRNSLLPLITMFVTIFPASLAGSIVIERIFTVPGMGSQIIEAIYLRDRELLLANTLMISGVNLFALLLADILYAFADPRVTYD